ncbi:MAG: zinc ABC transporter substrate-binding protein [Microbacteriaceae bacterium]|nr:zinc ABC transporter substrate-binding protein [Microbacteriaceae bacterium]
MTSTRRALPALLAATAAGIALTGCAAPAPEATGLSVVASTNVYGDIAAAIAGDAATVTSILDSPMVDPHSYEATAQDQLAIAGADLVIGNGAGYDPFLDVLVDGSGTTAVVIFAAVVAGLELGEAPLEDDSREGDDQGPREVANEHVWYDLHSMGDVAEAIAAELTELDAANASVYAANLDAFLVELEAVEEEAHALAEQLGGGVVASTEPVPAYLLAELGFDDETPEEFTEAIEEGADVPPLALQEVLDLIASGDVRLLAYNEQTASPETERVRAAAEEAGIPVVSFVETLPDGEDYLSWMRTNIDAVAAALAE